MTATDSEAQKRRAMDSCQLLDYAADSESRRRASSKAQGRPVLLQWEIRARTGIGKT